MMKDTALPAAMIDAVPMETVERPTPQQRARQRRAEAREFKVTVSLLFLFFLPIALISRLLPRRWRPLAALGQPPQSMVGEARSAANVIAPFMLSR